MNPKDDSATPMFDCFTPVANFTPYTALPLDHIDQCDEDLLNRSLWHARKESSAPYPRWALLPRKLRQDRD